MPIKAIILDVGGVLSVSLKAAARAYNHALSAAGLETNYSADDIWAMRAYNETYRHRDALKALYAITKDPVRLRWVLNLKNPGRFLQKHAERNAPSREALETMTQTYRFYRYQRPAPLHPQARKALRKLAGLGLGIGIFGGGPKTHIKRQLRDKHVLPYAQHFLAEEEVWPKPHPQGILHLCRKLGVTPTEVAYVADAEPDMLAAKKAGVRLVYGVSTNVGRRRALEKIQRKLGRPHQIFPNVYDVAEHLERRLQREARE